MKAKLYYPKKKKKTVHPMHALTHKKVDLIRQGQCSATLIITQASRGTSIKMKKEDSKEFNLEKEHIQDTTCMNAILQLDNNTNSFDKYNYTYIIILLIQYFYYNGAHFKLTLEKEPTISSVASNPKSNISFELYVYEFSTLSESQLLHFANFSTSARCFLY